MQSMDRCIVIRFFKREQGTMCTKIMFQELVLLALEWQQAKITPEGQRNLISKLSTSLSMEWTLGLCVNFKSFGFFTDFDSEFPITVLCKAT